MPKGMRVDPPGAVVEFRAAVGFPLREYIRKLGMRPKDVARSLHCPVGRLSFYAAQERLPYAMYAWMVSTWGHAGLQQPKQEQQKKGGFRIHQQFAPHLPADAARVAQQRLKAESAPPPPPPAPTRPDHPETISWELHAATLDVALDLAARYRAEKLIVEDRNRELQRIVDSLTADHGLEKTLRSLEGLHPMTDSVTPAVRPEVREAFQDLSQRNGHSAVISDLESRLPKAGAPR